MTETLNHLQKLTAAGVQFKSFTEHYLDSTGLFREAILGFLAAIAKQDRVRFSERIKAGAELRRLRGEGFSFKKIQVATGVSVTTMHKYLSEA